MRELPVATFTDIVGKAALAGGVDESVCRGAGASAACCCVELSPESWRVSSRRPIASTRGSAVSRNLRAR